ncbi:MAG: hypothetical protein EOO70_03320 [Myxococcaceae bacterium]|nr:MAG: hypothetical protein EOO70_03320 [Myxococcaceae bacterium]
MGEPRHVCFAEGCTKQLPARFLMCGPHWGKVSNTTQRAVYAAYKPGQTIATASDAWHQAVAQAVAEVAGKGVAP